MMDSRIQYQSFSGSPENGVASQGETLKDEEDRDDLSSIDENYDVASIASSMEDNLTCRGRMQEVLNGTNFHILIVALVILDIGIVLFELLLDVNLFGNIVCPNGNFMDQAEFCHFHRDSRDRCGPPPRLFLNNTFLALGVGREECKCGIRSGRQVCISNSEDDQVHSNPAFILHVISLFILTIFIVELIVKVIVFRLKYFTHKFEVLDGWIVLVSWMLDLASVFNEEAFQVVSLVIILRLWRVVRVIIGSVFSSVTQSNTKLHQARAEAKHIIHALHKAQEKIISLQNEKDSLEQKVKKRIR